MPEWNHDKVLDHYVTDEIRNGLYDLLEAIDKDRLRHEQELKAEWTADEKCKIVSEIATSLHGKTDGSEPERWKYHLAKMISSVSVYNRSLCFDEDERQEITKMLLYFADVLNNRSAKAAKLRSIWHPAEERPRVPDWATQIVWVQSCVGGLDYHIGRYDYNDSNWRYDTEQCCWTKWAYSSDLNNAVVPEEE